MHDHTVKSKDESDDLFAARTFKFGQLLTKLFNILYAKNKF